MANIFEQTIVPKVPFSNFPLSEMQILTHNFGQLVPCYLREVLPNDVISLSAFADVEFAPMVAPMKQDAHLSVHFFYFPDRIVFEDFETFITGSEDGHALTSEAELARMPDQPGFTMDQIYSLAYASQHTETDSETGITFCNWQGSVLDYLGLPSNVGGVEVAEGDPIINSEVLSDIPLRGYYRIWYDYYRDENLQAEFSYNGTKYTYYDLMRAWKRTDQGLLTSYSPAQLSAAFNKFNPLYRAFKKDYFTAALQSPQKGEPVTINLGSDAPVTVKTNTTASFYNDTEQMNLYLDSTPEAGHAASLLVDQDSKLWAADASTFSTQVYGISNIETVNNLVADLSRASAVTVEALREAFAVQEILESLSMRGSRFTEFLRGNFGVTPDDYRLQRPQFLGGMVSQVAIQKVLQTSGYSGEDSRDMTGYAAGRAFASAGQRIFRQRFKEHGYIIGILSVMPKAYYYQGIPRHFLRKDRFDYYLPQTAHLGEQGIENQELFYNPLDPETNKKVFGFIPRWAEYKTSVNGIHGDFRGNLNYYHMARVFDSLPTLSEEFISTKNVQTRPWAVWQATNPSINHILWTSVFFQVTGSRPLPYHSIPKVM